MGQCPSGAGARRQSTPVSHLIAARVLAAMVALLAAVATTAQVAPWTVAQPTTDRIYHTATLLGNGKVLVAGGGASWTELYDPATATWSDTPNSPQYATSQTANLLANGKVLLAAGAGISAAVATADLYNPATGLWSATGNLAHARYWHSSVTLANGKVLVMGGKSNATTWLASAEIYDPASGTWSATGSMATPRALFPAIVLDNGKVMVAGGYTTNNVLIAGVEIYDPASGTWAAGTPLEDVRAEGLMVRLNDGRLMIAGGKDPLNCTWTVEFYDQSTHTWTWARNMHFARGGYFTLTLMPDGQVLAVGGVSTTGYWNSAEMYDPVQDGWKYAGHTVVEHVGHTATLLRNGEVLITAGYTPVAELFGPPVPRTKTDFNADGKSDIVFSNNAASNWLFRMNGASVLSTAPLPGAAPGWVLAGTGDFDGNGSADLLWRNVANPAQYWIYLLSGTTMIGGGSLVVAPGYRPTFIADFNGDGKADILWENGGNGRWIYFMNGVHVLSAKLAPGAASGYFVSGVGDFNGDHHADLLWSNARNPLQHWIYLMQNGSVTGGGPVGTAQGFVPTRIADFNGDGRDDILWEDRHSLRWLYFMNGATVASTKMAPAAAPGWNVVGAADFDNNHSADLIWQNANDPTQFWIYLMTAGNATGGGPLGVADGYVPLTR